MKKIILFFLFFIVTIYSQSSLVDRTELGDSTAAIRAIIGAITDPSDQIDDSLNGYTKYVYLDEGGVVNKGIVLFYNATGQYVRSSLVTIWDDSLSVDWNGYDLKEIDSLIVGGKAVIDSLIINGYANIVGFSNTVAIKEFINDSLDNSWKRYDLTFTSNTDTVINLSAYDSRFIILDIIVASGGNSVKYITNGKKDQRVLIISNNGNADELVIFGNGTYVAGGIRLNSNLAAYILNANDCLELFNIYDESIWKEIASSTITYVTNNYYTQAQTKSTISDSLQNYKSDAEAVIDLGLKLNLSGGTMGGNVNVGNNDLTNIDDADIDKLDFGTVTSAIYDNLGSTILDWSLATCFQDTLIENLEYTFSNTISGKWITLELYNTASYTVDFPLTIRWAGGIAPTQTIDKTDIYQFYKSGTQVFGVHIPNF